MPFYEYECSACKFYVEALQKITDPPMVKCPSCAKDTLQRLISAPVFRLKGAGWYETDFKSDKENKRNLADGAEDKEPAAPSESEDKPAKVRPTKAKKSVGKAPVKKPVAVAKKAPAKKSKPKPAAKVKAKGKPKAKVKTTRKAAAKKKPAAKVARKTSAPKKKAAKKAARKK